MPASRMLHNLRDELARPPSRRLPAGVLGIYAVGAALLTHSLNGAATITWMRVYRPEDFPDVQSWLNFLREVRIPIPPVLATAEMVNHWLAGDTWLLTHLFYRMALVLAYGLAIWLSRASVGRLLASFMLGIVFVQGTAIVHPANPQLYDLVYPLLVLLFVWAYGAVLGAATPARARWPALGAGFALALAELTRPFVVLMLPIVLACVVAGLRRRPCFARNLCWFLAPVVLLSGGWHLHVALKHGRLVWTNHSGYNLHRAWVFVPHEPLIEERGDEPRGPNQYDNLDNPDHGENSRRLRRAVLGYIVEHPRAAGRHAARLLGWLLLDAPTDMYHVELRHPFVPIYRWTARLAAVRFVAAVVVVGFAVVLPRRRGLRFLTTPAGVLLGIAVMSTVVMAVGEDGEQARLLLSLLPMYAVLMPVDVRPEAGRR